MTPFRYPARKLRSLRQYGLKYVFGRMYFSLWILSQKVRGALAGAGSDHSQRPFCKRPFETFEVGLNGEVFVCCPSWLPKSIGNLHEQPPDRIWNSSAAREIRQSILDGSFRHCSRDLCPLLVNNGRPTLAQSRNPAYIEIAGKNISEIRTRPKTLTLSYDPTCNLSCPSCRKEKIAVPPARRRVLEELQEKIRSWGLEHAGQLALSGFGDPFSSALYLELLRSLSFEKYPRLRILLYTNGLLFTPELWKTLEGAQPLIQRVQVSIDAATEETYRKLRRGGDFSQLKRNLEFLMGLRKANKIQHLSLLFVVQAGNYREMIDFVRMGKDLGCDEIQFSRISNWGTYSSEEFNRVAIHLPAHPEYERFREILRHSSFQAPIVNRFNLGHPASLPPAR